jgi:hypothetical protein
VVTIIDEEDGYYRIKPPADAYLYVHQRYIDPVKQVAVNEKADEVRTPGDNTVAIESGREAMQATRPVTEIAVAPTTRPAGPDPIAERTKAETEYERLEMAAKNAMELPLDQQPLAVLMADYEKLLLNAHLPASMRRMADIRMASLRVKRGAQAELMAMRKQQEASAARLATIQAGRGAVEAKLAATGEAYTAVGALQASSVQSGDATLYRLTDPATGRTLCYLRSNDAAYVSLMGKIVGVKGELGTDQQLSLRVIQATSAAVIDPSKARLAWTAQIIPPSMLNVKPQTASTDQNE